MPTLRMNGLYRRLTLQRIVIAASFLSVLGAKWTLIARFGSITPFWDQWDGEAANLYKPYLEGTLQLSSLLAPHNEHRILWTRLLSLILLELDGRWNPILQMLVNAALHVGALVVLWRLIAGFLIGNATVAVAVLIAFVFFLPFGWENTLIGFQSQFYFLLIFSFFCFGYGTAASAFSRHWWLANASAIAAYFSMASGTFTLLALLSVHSAQWFRGTRSGRKEIFGLALGFASVLIMIWFVPTLPRHEPLKAHSVLQLLKSLAVVASWPLNPGFIGMAMLNAPAAIMTWLVIKRYPEKTNTVWRFAALVSWIALQEISLSYGRSVGIEASRYLDIIAISVIINAAGVLWLVQTKVWRLAWIGKTWALAIALVMFQRATIHLPGQIIQHHYQTIAQTANLKAFLADGKYEHLHNKPYLTIPYPSPDRLGRLLEDKTIYSILPTDLISRPAKYNDQSRLFSSGVGSGFMAALIYLMLQSAPFVLFGATFALCFAAVLMAFTVRSAAVGLARRRALPTVLSRREKLE